MARLWVTTLYARFLMTGLVLLGSSYSYASSGITYHGRILRPDGTPVSSTTTQFRVQIRTPGGENCLLWEEQQSRDLSLTSGMFTLTINDTSDPSLTANTLPYSLERVFSNRTSFTGLTGCSVGSSYNPSTADGRTLQVYFRESASDPWEQMPLTKINYVPLALQAVQLEGYSANEFLKIDPASSYTELTATQVNTLMDIIAGTNTQYLRPSTTFSGDVSGTYSATSVDKIKGVAISGTPSNGQVLKYNGTNWVPSADATGTSPGDASYTVKGLVQVDTNLATSGLNIASGVLSLPNTVTAGSVGSASSVPVITYDAKGRITATSTATVDDTTKLPKAGGTMSGSIDMGTQNITNATSVAATNISTRNVLLNDNDTNKITIKAPTDVTPSDYTLTLPATAGTNGYVLSTNGSGVLSWTNPSSLGASPAGSGSEIQYRASATTFGANSNFVWDNVNGRLGVGTAAPGNKLHVFDAKTDTGAVYTSGAVIELDLNPASNSSAYFRGSTNYVNSNGNSNYTQTTGANSEVWNNGDGTVDQSNGVVGVAFNNSPSAGVITTAVGVQGYTDILQGGSIGSAAGVVAMARNTAAGTIGDASGISAGVHSDGTGTITSASGVYAYVENNAGTIANSFGIQIGPVQGTNKWSLYSTDATAPSYFAGNVGIGTDTPSAKLEVAGQIKITGGTPGLGKVLTSDASGLATWTTLGGSESTSVNNVGAAGVSPFKQMNGAIIELRTINPAASSPVTVTLDAANNEIDLGVNAELQGLSGLSTNGFIQRTAAGTFSTAAVGTGAGTLAAGDDSRIVNAVQQSAYAADVAPAALCTTTQTAYWNTVADTWACQNIGTVANATTAVNFSGSLAGDVSGTQSATSVDKIKGKAVTAATANNQIMIYDGTSWVNNVVSGDATMASTGVLTLKNTGTAGTYYKVTTDAQGRVTSGSALAAGDITTALGYTPVNKAGDTMSGTLGLYATASDPSTTGWNATQKGYTWFNTTSNQVKYWDGSAIQALGISGAGLTSLGGQTGSTQTFAVVNDNAQTAPVLTSASDTHTFKYPMASQSGVLAGLLSKTEYDALNAKLTSPLTTKGDILTRDGTTHVRLPVGTDGQVLSADSAQTSGLKWITPTSGTVTSVTSANTDIGVATGTTTPVLTLNSGTSANQIVKLDGTAKLPAVDGSQLTSLNPANLSAAVSTSKGGTGLSSIGTANQILGVNSGATGLEYKTITAGTGVTISHGANSVTINATGSGGTVTNVSSANSYLSVATGTTTPVITANVGTAANTLAAGDDSRIVNAVQQSAYAADVTPVAGTSCTNSQTVYWNTVSDAWACRNLDITSAAGFIQNGGNTTGAAITVGTNDNFGLNFETNNATQMTLLPNGNLGLGVTNPGFKLTTVTTGATSNRTMFSSETGGTDVTLETIGSGGGPAFSTQVAGAGWTKVNDYQIVGTFASNAHDGAALRGAAEMRFQIDGTVASGSLPTSIAFYTNSGTTTISEKMRISAGGNVGIGTNNPGSKLDVAGNINATGTLHSDKQVSAGYTSGASDSVNWDNGNVQTISSTCQSLAFTNMQNGGTYTLIVTDTATTGCVFPATINGGTAVTWKGQPTLTSHTRTASSHTVYTMLRAGSIIYVSWITGF